MARAVWYYAPYQRRVTGNRSPFVRPFQGGVIFFEVLHMPYMVINDGRVCHELLDKRPNIYSDRPRNTMAKDL